jgi:hypothetical protein
MRPEATSNYNIVTLHVDLIPLDSLVLAKCYVHTYIYQRLYL